MYNSFAYIHINQIYRINKLDSNYISWLVSDLDFPILNRLIFVQSFSGVLVFSVYY